MNYKNMKPIHQDQTAKGRQYILDTIALVCSWLVAASIVNHYLPDSTAVVRFGIFITTYIIFYFGVKYVAKIVDKYRANHKK